MLGVCGEYIVTNTNTTDNIVNSIKTYEIGLALDTVPSPFIIKKIGIKAGGVCTLAINGRNFTLEEGETFEFGYGVCDIKSIVAGTADVALTIRYLY